MPQSQTQKKKVKDLMAAKDRAHGLRQNWEHHWQEVADLVDPTRDFTFKRTPGEQRRSRIYDTTAPDAHESLAAAVHGLLTNPAIRWLGMAAQSFEGGIDDNITEEDRAWLYDVTSMVLHIFNSPRSGFPTNSFEVYLDEVAFGTGVMLVREKANGITFQARCLNNFWMTEDDEGQMDQTIVEFMMTAREIVNRWGEDSVSDAIAKCNKDEKKCMNEFKIVHHINRRDKIDPTRRNQINKPWASFYYEEKECYLLSEGGFDESPYLAPRWSKAPQETYGRGPAIRMLPKIKAVNAKAKTQLLAGALATHPPLLTPANSIEGVLNLVPGAMIPYKANGRDVPTPLNTGVRPDTGASLMEEDRQAIERAFFLDVFKLPDRDRMTATEIIERRQQGLLKASPILSRQYAEFLTPVVSRVYRYLLRRGLLPPAPDSMRGRTLTVDYVSPMALAQRASEVQAFDQAMLSATPILQADPAILQTVLNPEESVRQIFSSNNVNPRYLRTREESAQRRQTIEQQQAQAAQAEAGASSATAVRDTAAGIRDLAQAGAA